MNNSYIYIYHVNVTQTVPDISPLMPMHQDPLLVFVVILIKLLNKQSSGCWNKVPLVNVDGLVQDCGNSSVLAIVSLQSCPKPVMLCHSKDFLTHLLLDKMAAILADTIFKCILLNEKFCIVIRISLKFVPKGPIDNKWALVQVMAWRQTGDKPLPGPMMTSSLMHTCSTMGRWVKYESKHKNKCKLL